MRRRTHAGTARQSLALLVLAALNSGCLGGAVGARRVSGDVADRRLAANVLATGEPSVLKEMVEHLPSFYDFGSAITGGMSEFRFR